MDTPKGYTDKEWQDLLARVSKEPKRTENGHFEDCYLAPTNAWGVECHCCECETEPCECDLYAEDLS